MVYHAVIVSPWNQHYICMLTFYHHRLKHRSNREYVKTLFLYMIKRIMWLYMKHIIKKGLASGIGACRCVDMKNMEQ